MNQQEFLKRFHSNAGVEPAAFDRDELSRWAAGLQAGLPPRRDALAAQFQQALEAVGGKFYAAGDAEDSAKLVCDLVQQRGVRSVISWDHPVLETAQAALRLAGVAVSLSQRAAGQEREAIRAATIASDIGLTSCNYALADTGTLLLVGNERQGRLTSLVPITHIAIITAEQLVPTFADAVKLLRLTRLGTEDGRLPSNISLHTGPSKTADIEQTLTKGVHGPKEVHVILNSGR